MLFSALFLCSVVISHVDAAGISDTLNDDILGNSFDKDVERAESLSMGTRKSKLLSNLGGIFGEPFCTPTGSTGLSGVCKNELTCLSEKGLPNFKSNCTTLQGTCCEYRRTCGGSSGQRLTFWQNTGYPDPLTEPGICTFKLAPAANVCYIRVEFLDLVLDSQIKNQCMANVLYILNMADGNGSPMCGALTGFETYLKVKPPPQGLKSLLSFQESLIFLINLKTINSTITPAKFQLRLTQIPCDSINTFTGRSMETSRVGPTYREARRKINGIKAQPTSFSKTPIRSSTSPSRKPDPLELINQDLLKCLGNTSKIFVPPIPINLSFLGKNIFSDVVEKIVSKMGLLLPNRIAGGSPITDVRKEFPWLGYMLLKNEFDEPSFCGTVLIGPKHALTAAHCLTKQGFSGKNYNVKVRFGRTDISNSTTMQVSLIDLYNDPLAITVKRIITHALYDSVTLEYDIAVLELPNALKTLTPVKLPSATGNFDGKDAKVLGWGYTGVNSGFPRNPNSLDVKILTNVGCNDAWKTKATAYSYSLPTYVQDVMICSNNTKVEDAGACIGDSGGPLVVEESGSHTLVGINAGVFFNCMTSGGTGGKIGTLPDVATRVSEILDFINVATS